METRARYALIGLFMLAVIVGELRLRLLAREQRRVRPARDLSGPLRELGVRAAGRLGGPVQRHPRRRGHRPLRLIRRRSRAGDRHDRVDRGTPIRSDTEVGLETQGLTGGAAVTLRGGSAGRRLAAGRRRAAHS